MFTLVILYWEMGNNQTLEGILGIGSDLILIFRDPKHHLYPQLKRGQVLNKVLFKVWLTMSPIGPQTLLVAISVVLKDILSIGIAPYLWVTSLWGKKIQWPRPNVSL